MPEQLDTLLQTFGRETEQSFNVRMEEEVDESIKSLLFDEEMDASGQTCIEDGDWSPPIGGGEEPEPGPSQRPDTPQGLLYNMQKKGRKDLH